MDLEEMKRLCREAGGLMPETQLRLLAVVEAVYDTMAWEHHVAGYIIHPELKQAIDALEEEPTCSE